MNKKTDDDYDDHVDYDITAFCFPPRRWTTIEEFEDIIVIIVFCV